MATVQLKGGRPLQVEIPEGVSRSCKGSIHLRPSSIREVTDGELEVLLRDPQSRDRIVVIESKQAAQPPRSSTSADGPIHHQSQQSRSAKKRE